MEDNQADTPTHVVVGSSDCEDRVKILIRDGVYVKPKRALTAYNLFFREERQKMLENRARNNSPKIGFAAMARTVSTRWKAIDQSERELYLELAAQDKIRYTGEMKLWKKVENKVNKKNKKKEPRHKRDKKLSEKKQDIPQNSGVLENRISSASTDTVSPSSFDLIDEDGSIPEDSVSKPTVVQSNPTDSFSASASLGTFGLSSLAMAKCREEGQMGLLLYLLRSIPCDPVELADILQHVHDVAKSVGDTGEVAKANSPTETEELIPQEELDMVVSPFPPISEVSSSSSSSASARVSVDRVLSTAAPALGGDPLLLGTVSTTNSTVLGHNPFDPVGPQRSQLNDELFSSLADEMGDECASLFLDMFRSY